MNMTHSESDPPSTAFPLHALVPWHREMVETVAESTQTDPAMAAMLSLGALSASVSRKGVLRMPSGRRFPLNLWVLVAAGSGENKSAVFQHVVEPLETVQAALDSGTAGAADPSPAPISVWQRLREEDDAGGLEAEVTTSITDVTSALIAQQELAFPGMPVDFLTTEITPTALIDMMAKQTLGIAQISAEGGFEAWISSGGQKALRDQGLLNLAWDGAVIRQRRLARRVSVDRATLTTAVTIQPERLAMITKNASLRAIGYTLRFLVCYPQSRRGVNRAPFPPVNGRTAERYRSCVWSMLALPSGPRRFEAERSPFDMTVTHDAGVIYDAYYNALQPRIRDGGDLASVHDWIEKLRLNTVRMAGVLHLARNAPAVGADAFAEPVRADSMEAAIAIASSLIPHGARAFGGRPVVRDAEQLVLAAVRDIGAQRFSVRDLQRNRHGRSLTSAQIQDVVGVLVTREAVVRVGDGALTGGRPAADLYEVVQRTAGTNSAPVAS
jgi:replicative DNA helicase